MRKSGAWRSRGFEKIEQTVASLPAAQLARTSLPAKHDIQPETRCEIRPFERFGSNASARIRAEPNDTLQALNISPFENQPLQPPILKQSSGPAEHLCRVSNSSLASSRCATEDRRKHRTVATRYATAYTMTICDILRAQFSLPSPRAPEIANGLFRREAATMPGGHSAPNQ
jgi:hypothetical protein